MGILNIPLLDQVMTQLDEQGADLQNSIDGLLEGIDRLVVALDRNTEAMLKKQ